MEQDWPAATREVHLLGGAVAINSIDVKNKIHLYPDTIDYKTVVVTIPRYSALYLGLEKINIDQSQVIGTEFITDISEVEGSSPTEWRTFTKYKSKQWAHSDARHKWNFIATEAYDNKNGHLWDNSRRITHQIITLNETFKDLSYAYRSQLYSKTQKNNFEVGARFINGYSSKIYDKFQHFLFDCCILRDYLSEFVFHYCVPNYLKDGIKHMTTTSRIYKKFFKDRECTSKFDLYYKSICSESGWLFQVGIYRDLVMHVCPLTETNENIWIRCGSLKLNDGKELPRIIAPIPINPSELSLSRSNFKYFEDFDDQTKGFSERSNALEHSHDLLEYAHTVMREFGTFLWSVSEQSPIKGKMIVYDEHNILGGITSIDIPNQFQS